MRKRLNATTIKELEAAESPYEIWDTDVTGFLLRVQPSGSMTYYLSYRNAAGTRKRSKIGSASHLKPAQARDQAQALAARVALGEDPQAGLREFRKREHSARENSLGRFLERDYGPWSLTHHGRSAETLARIRRCFAGLLDRPMDSITASDVEKWRTGRRATGATPQTVNRDLTTLRAALNKAVEWDVLEQNPISRIRPIRCDRTPSVRYLSSDEEKRLRKGLIERDQERVAARDRANQWRSLRSVRVLRDFAPDAFTDHLHPMVLLSLNTGLRRGELFRLSWYDVDFHQKVLTVRGAISKSGQTRHLPLNDEARKVLQSWEAQRSGGSELVFPGADGAPLTNIKKAWTHVLSRSGIPSFRFHDLRVTRSRRSS